MLAQASQALVSPAVTTGALAASGVIRCAVGATGRGLAGDGAAAVGFRVVAGAGPDIAAVQTQAGRPW